MPQVRAGIFAVYLHVRYLRADTDDGLQRVERNGSASVDAVPVFRRGR